MSKTMSKTPRQHPVTGAAEDKAQDTTAGLKPTENEMNFEHVLRRLTIERDEARRSGG